MTQELFNILAGAAFSVGGWFARVLWVAVRDLEKDLARLREDLPRTYTPKSEFRELAGDITLEMREGFNRLYLLIESKADK